MFENIDEIRTAERNVQSLSQIKSAIIYALFFQQYAIRTK